VSAEYDEGLRDGYRRGEMERIALATANSELRSELLAVRQELDRLVAGVSWR